MTIASPELYLLRNTQADAVDGQTQHASLASCIARFPANLTVPLCPTSQTSIAVTIVVVGSLIILQFFLSGGNLRVIGERRSPSPML